jgi:hypothetical protein
MHERQKVRNICAGRKGNCVIRRIKVQKRAWKIHLLDSRLGHGGEIIEFQIHACVFYANAPGTFFRYKEEISVISLKQERHVIIDFPIGGRNEIKVMAVMQ